MNIELCRGDITQEDVDAIVNAANTHLIMGGGVAGAIRRAGGEVINNEAINLGPIPLGEAAITSAGKLKARFVIHAASIHLGSIATADSIHNSIKNSLYRAEENKLKSIAFPAVGCGIAGFSIKKGARIILQTLLDFKPSSLEKARVILYSQSDYNLFNEIYHQLFQEKLQ